jgi:cytochrome P450
LQEVTDQVLTFLVAGHETTSNALAWTFYLLSHHPEVEHKLREEVKAALAASATGELTWDLMGELPYLNAVCHVRPRAPNLTASRCTQQSSVWSSFPVA